MFKKIIGLAMALVVAFTFTTQTTSHANDIKGHQMVTELTYWADLGVIRPDTKGKYNPNRAVTRGEFASYITRALKLPASATYSFKDLKVGNPLTLEIQAAAGANILSGYNDGTFRPNEKITRQHMAGMLKNALRYAKVPLEVTPLTFKDNNKITESFKPAVATNVYYKIISGSHTKNGVYFNPQDSATIAHAAAFLYRANNAILQFAVVENPDDSDDTIPIPEVPVVNPNVYYVAKVSGGTITKDSTVYFSYEQAEAAMTASGSNIIYKGDRIIKMSQGIASASDTKSNTTTVYSDKNFTKSLTYAAEGSEFKYIGSNDSYAIVQIADTKGYARINEVTLTPTSLIKGQNYYYVAGGLLTHKIYDHLKQAAVGEYFIGTAPSFMKPGAQYYSQDGVNFYSDKLLTSKVGTYYSYFQFQSVRQPSNYTAEELDRMIMTLLEERKATGLPRYAHVTTESRLIGMGHLLKKVEAEHHVNALFILAASMHEGDYGISTNSMQKNNIFGIKVFDNDPTKGEMYVSRDDSVMAFINRYVNLNYAPQTGAYAKGAAPGNKTAGMNVHYASDPFWGSKIAGHMFRMDNRFGKKDFNQAKIGFVSYENGHLVNIRTEPAQTSADYLHFTYKAKNVGETGVFGYPVVIIEETQGSDGYVWYKILSDSNPPAQYGWVRADLVQVIQTN